MPRNPISGAIRHSRYMVSLGVTSSASDRSPQHAGGKAATGAGPNRSVSAIAPRRRIALREPRQQLGFVLL